MSFSISNDLKNYLTSITLCKFDFNLGIAEIEKFFDSGYAQLKKDWLYNVVYPMSKLEWMAFCKDTCGRFERMPNVKQLIDIGLSKFRTAKENRITLIEAFYAKKGIKKCQFCEHTGLINAHRILSKDRSYAFRCPNCEFSRLRGLSSQLPEWGEVYQDRFERLTTCVVGRKDESQVPVTDSFQSQEEFDKSFEVAFGAAEGQAAQAF